MSLDNMQREIVTSDAKNIIVSAGAGSGKTRVLTERVKFLLDKGVSPENIVAITFTNKAADEMKSRLYNVSGIGDTFIGTIHSFANKVFKNSGTPYSLLTSEMEITLMKDLIDKYAKYITKDTYLYLVDTLRDVKMGLLEEDVVAERFLPSVLDEIKILSGDNLDEEYPENMRTVCKKLNIITFNELLKECSRYFESINGKLEYLLVDELQDIGHLESEFLFSLHADNNFFVGDDWQSIYGFKGGNVSIFLNLMEDPDWTSYYLTLNYRNATNILDVAKTVIHQADNILNKEVVAVRKDPGIVEISSKYNLIDYLNKIKESGDYKDWFILVRSNKDILEMSSKLSLLEIPFISFKQGGNTNEDINLKMALDSVKLLTVHSAKGLESKNVLLYGNFPIHQKPYLRNSDERKVMYVGITRAQDKLIILN